MSEDDFRRGGRPASVIILETRIIETNESFVGAMHAWVRYMRSTVTTKQLKTGSLVAAKEELRYEKKTKTREGFQGNESRL